MKIALVYLGRRGGGAQYSLEMAKALHHEHEVLAIISAQAENINTWRDSGINLFEVDTYTNIITFVLASMDIRRFFRIRKRIQSFNADVVYYPMDHFWIPGIQYLLPHTPHILTLHDPKQHLGERNLLLEFFSAQSIKRASGIVILSSVFKEDIRAMGFSDEQIAVIPHGEFSSYSRGRGSDRLPTEGALLFFGRISEYKGVGVLLDAFARIAIERPSAKLLMAGSGELEKYRRKIEVIPAAQIEIVNEWIDDEEINHYFSRASFVVLPYIDGTQSGVIAAAYGFGLPVIASRVGGLSEQVVDGVTGFLVEPSNVDELVDRCLQLLDNPDLVKRLGDNAYAVTQDELSWDTLSKKLSQFLERFI